MFRHNKHDVFVLDQTPRSQALQRMTQLGTVSHQDDLEIVAYHGITELCHPGCQPQRGLRRFRTPKPGPSIGPNRRHLGLSRPGALAVACLSSFPLASISVH